MDHILTSLRDIVRSEVLSYATNGYNAAGERSRLYYAENSDENVFSVLAPFDPVYKRADLVMMVRVVNEQVIIDVDKTSKPLYDALRAAGVSANQFIIPA